MLTPVTPVTLSRASAQGLRSLNKDISRSQMSSRWGPAVKCLEDILSQLEISESFSRFETTDDIRKEKNFTFFVLIT